MPCVNLLWGQPFHSFSLQTSCYTLATKTYASCSTDINGFDQRLHTFWETASRLILILDTTHSYMWAKEVQRVWGEYVAIQTCTFQKSIDPEYGNRGQVGTFTQDWVHYNEDADIYPGWSDKERTVRAVYKVSKCWTDFTFHLPTVEDIHNHWDSSFPKCMKPLISYIVTVSLICGGNQSTLRKPLTCRKSRTNFITLCCTEYTSSERDSNSH
jgi:hypothetical protein